MWGVFDKRTILDYGENILGVSKVIPQILNLFSEYNIHCTWATVGGLFYETIEEINLDFPDTLPTYLNDNYSAYSHLRKVESSNFKKYYSGLHLIHLINKTPGQEIGTHTFSHYYCLEPGQNIYQFKADINRAVSKCAQYGIINRSIIFPRNQYCNEYLKICNEAGINSFRGNENNFLQKPRSQDKLSMFIRFLRLLDTYVNLTGYNIYSEIFQVQGLINIKSSFFFRPFNKKLSFLENLKIRRYKKAMLMAAKSNSVFHIWWHPHNFGANSKENLKQLKELLDYFKLLNKNYGMQSLNMKEISDKFNNK